MLKGINQWCYPDGTPLEKVFEYSQRAGFDAVELNMNPNGGVGLTMETTLSEAESIAAMAKRYDLKLRSLSTALFWEFPLSDPDKAVRKKGQEVLRKQIELAEAMGMDTVLVVPGIVNSRTPYETCYANSRVSIETILPQAEQAHVRIGLENVGNKFLLSPMEFVSYIDSFQSPALGAYFDIGNALHYGYPEHWIKSLGERIFKVHAKDFSESNQSVPLLAGDVNWKDVMTALYEIGYNDTVTAELTPYKTGPELLAYDTARHLETLFNWAKPV
ncbi:sugar phosphate isomerase/epimerase [Pullulanibacillus sp. KACC 23026]|uniref:sugar phosphate isomerase/epimerase family protein n=1 Tax=Pullulanibacillus sp. KACC 23026 TaxID=3028315 RepID=UPI0023B0A5AA|nr:sugar phosphate isomerase/epimerase family protein [Pullulanibacillus sp. KACC 23026]WEG11112.1 sugar phosphate isomerase/epimerase [Pullulanibacillus sp. KACC 23026]